MNKRDWALNCQVLWAVAVRLPDLTAGWLCRGVPLYNSPNQAEPQTSWRCNILLPQCGPNPALTPQAGVIGQNLHVALAQLQGQLGAPVAPVGCPKVDVGCRGDGRESELNRWPAGSVSTSRGAWCNGRGNVWLER